MIPGKCLGLAREAGERSGQLNRPVDPLGVLPGAISRGPGPLKVVTAQGTRYVHRFSNKIEIRHRQRRHSFGGQNGGIHAAQGNLGGPVTLGALGNEGPTLLQAADLAQVLGRTLADGPVAGLG